MATQIARLHDRRTGRLLDLRKYKLLREIVEATQPAPLRAGNEAFDRAIESLQEPSTSLFAIAMIAFGIIAAAHYNIVPQKKQTQYFVAVGLLAALSWSMLCLSRTNKDLSFASLLSLSITTTLIVSAYMQWVCATFLKRRQLRMDDQIVEWREAYDVDFELGVTPPREIV